MKGDWRSDENLKPVIDDDGLLQYDVESFGGVGSQKNDLQAKLLATQQELANAHEMIMKMKGSVHKLLGEKASFDQRGEINVAQEEDFAGDERDSGKDEEEMPDMEEDTDNGGQMKQMCGALDKIAPVDSSYFCSYAGYSVHKDMLQVLKFLSFFFRDKLLMVVYFHTGHSQNLGLFEFH